ncbi:MAG: gamma-glutamyltransferase, partial [Chloroflexota bacterium]|nr:gamma-glutamyltransferase [Chloroflexota bacterium]
HTTLKTAQDLSLLARFPATRAIFTNGGMPLMTLDEHAPAMLRQPDLAGTLRAIADNGPRAFYEGELANAIANHLAEGGSRMTTDDLRTYTAHIEPALSIPYGDAVLHAPGKATGGTTLAMSMRLIDLLGVRDAGYGSTRYLHLIAEAFKLAFADRFAYLADPDFVEAPLDALLSDDYLRARAETVDADRATPALSGDRGALGVSHSLATSVPDYTSGGSTTHHSVIDRDGMAVSTTQTLLSLWGSGVTIPGTGILMNNGMMWFDPEPGRPNSVAGGKRPLSNMAPAVVTRGDMALAAIGASGGRRIMNCNAQLALNLIDRNMSMQPATSAPRLDRSTPALFVSPRFGSEAIKGLRSLGHKLVVKDERQLLGDFSSPASVRRDGDGQLTGGVDPYYYPATAVGVD